MLSGGSMKQYLDNIEIIIDKELSTYELLEKSINEKTDLIVKNDIQALEELDMKIIEQTAKAAQFARARQQECIQVGRIDLTFTELIQKTMEIDKTQAERFKEKKSKLEELVSRIQKMNNRHAKLIENTLFIMSKTTDFILKMVAPELDMYNETGHMKKINDNYKISSIEQEA